MESGGTMQADEQSPLLPVEPGYKSVLRLRYAISWGILAVVALIVDRSVLWETPIGGLLPLAVLAIGLLATLVFPARIYRRLRYRLFSCFWYVWLEKPYTHQSADHQRFRIGVYNHYN